MSYYAINDCIYSYYWDRHGCGEQLEIKLSQYSRERDTFSGEVTLSKLFRADFFSEGA